MFHLRFTILFAILSIAFGQTAPNRYALILEDPPTAERFPSGEKMRSAEAGAYRRQIEARQKTLHDELDKRKIRVTGSVSTVQNAIFVVASPEQAAELKNLPGVKDVVPLKRYKMKLNRATQLLNAPAAWNVLGGQSNGGAGVKIAILDTGIDQTHPAFQDSSLAAPGGYPICNGADCAFTNSKVIVARSYVRQLAAGSAPDPVADSRPDDYSPRDRIGHGTAVASCAAGAINVGLLTISGMAPKAYLGNYKIYGSAGVNDGSSDDVIIQALEDAVNDGMDIISFSTGGPAFTGPLDSGAACGNRAGVACDLLAQTFENVARQGVVIVAAAGNEGEDGVSSNTPSYNTIDSPADAPSVIAAAATTNSHTFSELVTVPGSDAPANLKAVAVQSGDALVPLGAVTAPLLDVTQTGDNGLACSALPAASLVDHIALILRGTCDLATKLSNAEDAGAGGVIFYMADASTPISPGGLASFPIPAVMISNSDGLALKSFAAGHPEHPVTIAPAGIERTAQAGQVAGFSSAGPVTGSSALKPDVAAVGTSVYMAGQNYDPAGELYSSDRYVVADGTSFATPMISGAAAMVKQKHPEFTAAEIKSALVNTASAGLSSSDVRLTGAGKLDAGAAVNDTVSVTPSSVSFGVLTPSSPTSAQQLQVVNNGGSTVNLTIAASGAVTVDRMSLALAAGASGAVTVSKSGSLPAAGGYSGAITMQGSGVSLRVPYLYSVASGVPGNLIPLSGLDFDGTVGSGISEGIISFKLVDTAGLPIAGAPVSFTSRGGGTLRNADSATDSYGIAAAEPVLGSQPGQESFTAVAGGLRETFSGFARLRPAISPGGIVNAADFDATAPVAPGSYIAIFGTALSDFTDYAESAVLPLAIDEAFVSFDVPSAGISVPGHLVAVSATQITLQAPWELAGQTSAQVKVTISFSNGNVVSVPLADYAPSWFGSSGIVAARDTANNVITASNPARRGQAVQLFANGLGPVTNQPASGDPAPAGPFAETTSTPVVRIGGQSAAVSFSGLAPGTAGLYQINVTVPDGVAAGSQAITVEIGGKVSKALNLPVQ